MLGYGAAAFLACLVPGLNLAALLIRAGELARARELVEEASRFVQDPQENEAVWELRNRLRSQAP